MLGSKELYPEKMDFVSDGEIETITYAKKQMHSSL